MVAAQATDIEISEPLWEWPPGARLAVLRERSRRFGMGESEDGGSP